jgi:L,D-transpeptidase ErfK/SrfK
MFIQQLVKVSTPQRKIAAALASVFIMASHQAQAIAFLLPEDPKDSLIREFSEGAIKQTIASKDEDLLDIARRFDLGQNEIIRLNPDVDRWLPEKAQKFSYKVSACYLTHPVQAWC